MLILCLNLNTHFDSICIALLDNFLTCFNTELDSSATPPDSYLGSATPPDSYLGSATPPDSYLGSATPPDSYLGSATPPDSYLGSATPPDSYLASATPPASYLGSATPPASYLGSSPCSNPFPSICKCTFIWSVGLARNWPMAPVIMPVGMAFL